jgi:hypothetical protein
VYSEPCRRIWLFCTDAVAHVIANSGRRQLLMNELLRLVNLEKKIFYKKATLSDYLVGMLVVFLFLLIYRGASGYSSRVRRVQRTRECREVNQAVNNETN